MSTTRKIVVGMLLAINFLLGMYLWSMAGQLVSSPSDYKVVIGYFMYLGIAAGAGLILGKVFTEIHKLKGKPNAKAE